MANFVLFIRVRLAQGKDFKEQALIDFLSEELKKLDASEMSHLEQEFENYENDYPLEHVRN